MALATESMTLSRCVVQWTFLRRIWQRDPVMLQPPSFQQQRYLRMIISSRVSECNLSAVRRTVRPIRCQRSENLCQRSRLRGMSTTVSDVLETSSEGILINSPYPRVDIPHHLSFTEFIFSYLDKHKDRDAMVIIPLTLLPFDISIVIMFCNPTKYMHMLTRTSSH